MTVVLSGEESEGRAGVKLNDTQWSYKHQLLE